MCRTSDVYRSRPDNLSRWLRLASDNWSGMYEPLVSVFLYRIRVVFMRSTLSFILSDVGSEHGITMEMGDFVEAWRAASPFCLVTFDVALSHEGCSQKRETLSFCHAGKSEAS